MDEDEEECISLYIFIYKICIKSSNIIMMMMMLLLLLIKVT